MNHKNYDVIIIGGGPAGYTAALYCARAALHTLVLEKLAPGGQMGTTDHVDNYPGFSDGIDGFTLGMEMQKQAERFGAQSSFAEVTKVNLDHDVKQITASGEILETKVVMIATGASPRELGLPRERELRGRGVSYCATCDGAFFKGKNVLVVGGGDTAAADALFLSKLCQHVTIIHRREKLRASMSYQKPLMEKDNVSFLWDTTVEELLGDGKLSGVKIKNKNSGEIQEISCDGLFAAVGNIPNTNLFQDVKLTPNGYIDAGEDTATNILGVYAIGDVRNKPLRQIVTAVSDGAIASCMAEEYLQQNK